jgi:aryl-alcohol dehydrogenase-like predicted oxidoreductase
MQTRQFGSTDLAVSAIGLGTFNTIREPNAVRTLVDRALDLGVTLFDTAESYANGQVESALGAALEGRRHGVILATKWGGGARKPEPGERRGGRDYIFKALDSSLKRLNTDYIDLYQYHHPDPETPIEETIQAMDDLVRTGKIRFWGLSNMRGPAVAEAWRAQRNMKAAPFVSCQDQYSLLDRRAERGLIPVLQRLQIGLLPYYPLARGLLTGKYKRGAPPPSGSRLAKAAGSPQAAQIFSDETFDKLERLEAFAAVRGRTLLDLAISWLLAMPQVTSIIAGATSPAQIEMNVAAADWRLTEEELREVDKISGESANAPKVGG